MLQLWGHDTGNNNDLSQTVQVVVNNSTAGGSNPTPPSPAPAPPTPAPVATNAPITLSYPLSGQAISGVVSVIASISQNLDAAGSYLMVDGTEAGWRRVGSAPYVYELDTAALSAGTHVLQIWAHTIANEALLSNVATVVVGH